MGNTGRKLKPITIQDSIEASESIARIYRENPNATDDEIDELIIADTFRTVNRKKE